MLVPAVLAKQSHRIGVLLIEVGWTKPDPATTTERKSTPVATNRHSSGTEQHLDMDEEGRRRSERNRTRQTAAAGPPRLPVTVTTGAGSTSLGGSDDATTSQDGVAGQYSERSDIDTVGQSSTSTWTRKGGGGANGTGPDRLRQRALPDFQSPLLLEQGARALAVATTQPRAKMAWQVNIRNAPTSTPWGNPGTPDTISYDDRHESQLISAETLFLASRPWFGAHVRSFCR
ncbi:hypothetical protein HPB47_013034 [Ixodes persulcatus]|uniref:Uncharacterized protein n=1 Tax=Ixodes persulcatus TaxID=34615 RepID=A0AC60NRV5_IXOPE|nr:hypothetical protein HPB47_013034 [Ixodes persulcatus]